METTNLSISNRFAEMGNLGAGEIAKEEETNSIGLILLKPDAVTSRLDLPIKRYIEDEIKTMTGETITLFAFNLVRLDKEKIAALYPQQKNAEYLKYIQDHLSSGPVYLVLALLKNAPETLNKIKGSVRNDSGVRGTFATNKAITDEELSLWQKGKLSDEETKRIGTELFAANLIHVPDDREETKKAISALYPPSEVTDMLEAIPIFARWYNNIK